MRNQKFIELSIFIIGIGLSLITNLITSDEAAVSIYNQNKTLIVFSGIGLIILSIFLSIKSNSSNSGLESQSRSFNKVFFDTIIAALLWAIFGALIGYLCYLVSGWFQINYLTIIVLSLVLSGMIAGTRFRFITHNSFVGMIVGGALGYAVLFYFGTPDSLTVGRDNQAVSSIIYLPSIISALIALFTNPFKESYTNRTQQERKVNEEEAKKLMAKFEIASIKLANKGFKVSYCDFTEYMQRENLKANANHLSEDQIVEHIISQDDSFGITLLRQQMMGQPEKPWPPYIVRDSEGNEKIRFSTIESLEEFSKM